MGKKFTPFSVLFQLVICQYCKAYLSIPTLFCFAIHNFELTNAAPYCTTTFYRQIRNIELSADHSYFYFPVRSFRIWS